MILQTVSIYDSKALTWTPHAPHVNIATALREFEYLCNQPESPYHIHAADFTLFHTGTWDNITNETTRLKADLNLGNALTFQTHMSDQVVNTADILRSKINNKAAQTEAMAAELLAATPIGSASFPRKESS